MQRKGERERERRGRGLMEGLREGCTERVCLTPSTGMTEFLDSPARVVITYNSNEVTGVTMSNLAYLTDQQCYHYLQCIMSYSPINLL